MNSILRHHTETLPPLETQKIFAQNRIDYEPILRSRLNDGEWVVAEDYKGTGIAWGMTFGVPKEELEKINKGLLKEDLALCMIGERFTSGIERDHLHEQCNGWENNKKIHELLAQEKGWVVVDSNGSIEQVHGRIKEAILENLQK